MTEDDRPPFCIVFLVRHGRTALNAAGVLRGHLDPPLDAVGRQQARALGTIFRNAPLGRVVASPLQRTVETASAISDAAEAELILDDRLLDRDYGPWAGRPAEEVLAQFPSIDDAPGVEDRLEFTRRVVAAFGEAAAAATSRRPVVLVAHDAVNRLILGPDVLGPDASAEVTQPPGCWNRLELGEHGWTAPVVGAVPGEDGPQDDRKPQRPRFGRLSSTAELLEDKADPVTMSAGASLDAVVAAMDEARVHEAFVVDHAGAFCGWVMRADAAELLSSISSERIPKVSELVRKNSVTVEGGTTVADAARRATAAGADRVIVLSAEGRPLGAVKLADLEELLEDMVQQ